MSERNGGSAVLERESLADDAAGRRPRRAAERGESDRGVEKFSIKIEPATGQRYMAVAHKGKALLFNPLTNKGTAFTRRERDELGLHGLVPPAFCTIQQQMDRTYENFQAKTSNMEKFMPAFAIDATPVTNAQYAEFLRATGYTPHFRENFLKHWTGESVPVGKEDHPVVYVSLDDARAYARWSAKAIPSEEQWQYAAQGPEGLTYPWGNTMEPGRCNGGQSGGTTGVRAFPAGRSPFGCYDFCGNVWEWTESERTDGRTRFCMIRGGSYYTAEGSHWYMDGGPRPTNYAAKFLLLWPGLDRCATIGFRCVAPLQQ